MKLKQTLRLAVGFGLVFWLLTPLSASAFYNPTAGRWLNRDPIEENGGANIYGFAQNTPTWLIDPVGKEFVDSGYRTVFTLPGGYGNTHASFTIDADCKQPPLRPTFYVGWCNCELRLKTFDVRQDTDIALYHVTSLTDSSQRRFSDSSISKAIAHEAQHRANFRSWYDSNRAAAEVAFTGTYSCAKCDQLKQKLVALFRASWKQTYDNERSHTGPNWGGWTPRRPEYAPEEDWWNGPVPLPLDDSYADPLGRF